jgi:hypothetical protein
MKKEGLSDPPRRNVTHPQERPKMEILSLNERFGEYFYNFLYCRKIVQTDDLLLNQLHEKMHVDLDVFGLLMMNRVLRDLDGALIVIVDD